MISYAQNHEDVLLDRLFPAGLPGFYIDVGAGDPVRDSVTKHFYDLGWTGINVEPSSGPYERLAAHRERDVNLNVGLSDHAGTLTLHEFPLQLEGCSTFSAGQAEAHRDGTGTDFVEREVPVVTLAKVCEEHAHAQIDFLSIDTEGHERNVLEGGDWKRWRPRVVLVESTQPNTLIPTHENWEHGLLEAGYLFAMFDGLNRFYVRAEDKDLLPALATPANVTDDFVPYRYQHVMAELRNQLDSLARQLAASRAVVASLEAQYGMLPAQLKILEGRYEDLQSWLQATQSHLETTRDSLADTQALYLHVKGEVADALAHCDETNRLVGEIGPVGMSMARRVERFSTRFPRAIGMLERAQAARLRVARAIDRRPS